MITIKEKGRGFRVTNYGTGVNDGVVIARDPFAVSLAVAHYTGHEHDPRCCPVCAQVAQRRRAAVAA